MLHEIPEFDEHGGPTREGAGAFITAFSARYNMPIGVAMSAIAFIQERLSSPPAMLVVALCRTFQMSTKSAAEAIEDVREEFGQGRSEKGEVRSSEMSFKVSIIKVLEYFWKNPSRNRLFATMYALNDPLLDDVIGHRSMAQFARDTKITKEAVRKEVKLAQDHFGLKPRPEQRGQEARAKMSAKRISQLEKRKA